MQRASTECPGWSAKNSDSPINKRSHAYPAKNPKLGLGSEKKPEMGEMMASARKRA